MLGWIALWLWKRIDVFSKEATMGDARRDARLLWELDVEGVGGQMVVADVNGDGRDEVLIYDRRKILVYGALA